MDEKEMKLPNVDREAMLSEKFWRREWVMDPVFLSKLPIDVITQMGKLRLQHLADCAQMEADVKMKEAEMFKQMAGLRF